MAYTNTPELEISTSQDNLNLQNVFDNLPMNKRNYKYNLCKIIDENTNNAKSSQFVDNVHMSPFDRPTNIYFTDSLDSLKSIKNTPLKGWASCKSNVCLREGLTYFEFQIKHIDWSKNCNARLGLSQRSFPLGQPVGSDLHNSIGIRDMTFERIFNRKRDDFINNDTTEKLMKEGDSIGFLVNLPSLENQYKQIQVVINQMIEKESDEFELFHLNRYLKDLENIYLNKKSIQKERILIRYKNETYYESQDYVRNETLKTEDYLKLDGSFIKVFQNGEYRGDLTNDEDKALTNFLPPFTTVNYETTRYKQIYNRLVKMDNMENIDILIPRKYYDDGSLGYYPTISLFNDTVVELNGTLDDMKYYFDVQKYILTDDSVLNKEVNSLEDVYLQAKNQDIEYDIVEFEKKKKELEKLQVSQEEIKNNQSLAIKEENNTLDFIQQESNDIEMEM